jgi:hypothetical protein
MLNDLQLVKPFDIICSTDPRSPFSWLVKMGTQSKYSHTFVVAKDPSYCYTTSELDYKMLPLEKYLIGKKYTVFRHKGLEKLRTQDPELYNQKILSLEKFHNGIVQTQYSWVDVTQLGIVSLFGRGNRYIAYNTKGYFCSEAVTEGFRDAAKLTLTPYNDVFLQPSQMTPKDVSLSNELEYVTSKGI